MAPYSNAVCGIVHQRRYTKLQSKQWKIEPQRRKGRQVYSEGKAEKKNLLHTYPKTIV